MIVILITIILVAWLVFERRRHERTLCQIPCRILVTGTRGKSSIVRLIHAGLSEGGKRVVAKTTGSAARIISADGTEMPVKRPGTATILEQMKAVRFAARQKADVLVVESMALRPELQRIESFVLLQPTTSVLANIRFDHMDVMGGERSRIAQTYAQALYPPALKIISEELAPLLEGKVDSEKVSWINPGKENYPDIRSALSWIEHPGNICLAIAAGNQCGIHESDMIAGMKKTRPDPGVLRINNSLIGERQVTFVNAFAANDPESLLSVWEMLREKLDLPTFRIFFILNTRRDRPWRTVQLAEALEAFPPAYRYLVIGNHIELMYNALDPGLRRKSIFLRTKEPQKIINALEPHLGGKNLLVGLGNYGGAGESLAEIFNKAIIAS